MRSWVLALAALALGLGRLGAARAEEDRHDVAGFPITFNEEIITRNDVLREIGGDEKMLGDAKVLADLRDGLLRRKLAEQVAADLGVQVTDEEVDRIVRAQIEYHGGEAKFFEWLYQRGDTLARFRNGIMQQVLAKKLDRLFAIGFTPGQSTLLPWRVRPTPREIGLAFKNDPARRRARIEVERIDLTVGLTRDERVKLAMRRMDGLSQKEFNKEAGEILGPRVEKAMALVRDGDVSAAAELPGTEVEKAWVEIEKGESARPDVEFLRTGEVGAWSKPFPQPDGASVRLLRVLERKLPITGDVPTVEASREYEIRIRELRGRKWRAVARLRALDKSTVRPERVRIGLRKQLVAELRAAEKTLRAFGIH